MQPRPKESIFKDGTLYLILFGVPFAAVGVFFSSFAVAPAITWFSLLSWQKTPAIIENAKLHKNQENIIARYSYEWEGKQYTTCRVTLEPGSNGPGKPAYEELAEHQASSEPFRCFVNPSEPSQAVLYRNLHLVPLLLPLLSGLVFSRVGFGLMAIAVLGRFEQQKIWALQDQYPEEPWRWKPAWQDGLIRSGSKWKMITMIFFAVLWNLLCDWIIFFIPGFVMDGQLIALVALLLPVIGIFLILYAIYLFLQWLRFGTTTFQMASVPGVLGGSLTGLVRIPALVVPESEVLLTLECLRKYTVSSGDGQSTQSLWHMEKVLPPDTLLQEGGKAAIPVDFRLPFNMRETDESDPGNEYLWRLRAHVPMPGIDFDAEFDVPVFKTEESDPALTTEKVTAMNEITVVDDDGNFVTRPEEHDAARIGEKLRAAGLRMEPCMGGGIAITFPMLRQPITAIGMMIFTFFLGGFVALMIMNVVNLLFLSIFGLIFLVIFLTTVDLWVGKSRIEINSRGLYSQRGPFGIGRKHHIPFNDIEKIDMIQGMRSGEDVYYRIYVKTIYGKRRFLASRVRQNQARTVIQALHTAIGEYYQG